MAIEITKVRDLYSGTVTSATCCMSWNRDDEAASINVAGESRGALSAWKRLFPL